MTRELSGAAVDSRDVIVTPKVSSAIETKMDIQSSNHLTFAG
jgi:hypothetical protein